MKDEHEMSEKDQLLLFALAQVKLIEASKEQQTAIEEMLTHFNYLCEKVTEVTTRVTYLTNAYDIVQDDLQAAFLRIGILENTIYGAKV